MRPLARHRVAPAPSQHLQSARIAGVKGRRLPRPDESIVVAAKLQRERGGLERTVGFARPYLLGLGYSIALFAFGWLTWRGRAAIVDICGRIGYRYDRREPPRIPEVAVDSLIADCDDLRLRALDNVDGNVTDRELIVLSGLVRS